MKSNFEIRLSEVYKSFTKDNQVTEVLKDFSYTIKGPDFITLFGPNGCGKTTLLNIIIGLEMANRGRVEIPQDTDHKPKMGVVFQDWVII